MTRHTLEQRRAADAMEKAKKASKNARLNPRLYRSYVDSLPASIIANGLGQAMATELAASGEHKALYGNLSNWLCNKDGVYRGDDLLEELMKGDQSQYLRAQAEALAWLVWHKKFCRAFLEESGEGSR